MAPPVSLHMTLNNSAKSFITQNIKQNFAEHFSKPAFVLMVSGAILFISNLSTLNAVGREFATCMTRLAFLSHNANKTRDNLTNVIHKTGFS
jgi:hypothetical protein